MTKRPAGIEGVTATRLLAFALFIALLTFGTGCAESLSTVGPAASVSPPPYLFWPPHGATSIAKLEPLAPAAKTLGEAAERIRASLRDAGYVDVRLYPIGVDYAHGFAIATRLERIDDDAAPQPAAARWFAKYPEPATLSWLESARNPRLPEAGRYRVFIIAFTNLPIGPRPLHSAPRWDEQTVMWGREMPPMVLPAARPVSVAQAYRVGAYVYEYAREAGEDEAEAVVEDRKQSAALHVTRAGIAGL